MSSGQEWQFHIVTDTVANWSSNMANDISGAELQFDIATGSQQWHFHIATDI